MTVLRDIRYRGEDARGLLDLYLPEGRGLFPVVICLHGGAWRQGDKRECDFMAPHLTSIGVAALAANYRFAPADRHPAQIEDVFAVLDWIAAHAAERRLDPQRIGLTGWSAGGHLTMLAGVTAGRRSGGWRIRGIVPLCGVCDLTRWVETNGQCAEYVVGFLGGLPAERREAARDGSPITHVHADAPPCLAFHGDIDAVVHPSQSVTFADALRTLGVDAQAVVLPGIDHNGAMPGTNPMEPLGGARAFQAFFLKHLHPETMT